MDAALLNLQHCEIFATAARTLTALPGAAWRSGYQASCPLRGRLARHGDLFAWREDELLAIGVLADGKMPPCPLPP
jgi:hypothetical protein